MTSLEVTTRLAGYVNTSATIIWCASWTTLLQTGYRLVTPAYIYSINTNVHKNVQKLYTNVYIGYITKTHSE